MARTGISYTDVAQAAVQLVGQNKNPTITQIRYILGTGSSTTIGNYLRQWKAHQEADSLLSAKENLPTELIAIMKGLWARVMDLSQEKLLSTENSYQQTISELEIELEKYRTNNQRWQKVFNQWQQEKSKLDHDKITLEQALEFAHKEIALLKAKQDALLQQLQEKQDRIDELNRLHKQTQHNLEHYRESAREQRLQDLQQHEQQTQQLQQELYKTKEQLTMHRDQMALLQHDLQTLIQKNNTLEKANDLNQSHLAQLRTQVEKTEKSAHEHLLASEHWQNRYTETQKILDEQKHRQIDLHAEVKLLTQQLTATKQLVQDAENYNKLLNSEKWELTQEKSHLEGRLRQMQELITT